MASRSPTLRAFHFHAATRHRHSEFSMFLALFLCDSVARRRKGALATRIMDGLASRQRRRDYNAAVSTPQRRAHHMTLADYALDGGPDRGYSRPTECIGAWIGRLRPRRLRRHRNPSSEQSQNVQAPGAFPVDNSWGRWGSWRRLNSTVDVTSMPAPRSRLGRDTPRKITARRMGNMVTPSIRTTLVDASGEVLAAIATATSR